VAVLNWLRLQGSNLDCRVQSAVSCHWTKPQISGRVIPSRLHVLENQLAPGFSPSHSHQPASHVGCVRGPSRLWDNRHAMRRKGENPQQIHVVKQQPAPSQRHRDVRAKARDASRGHNHRGRVTVGWFSPNLRFLSWRGLPAGGSSGLRLSSLGALEAVTYRV
jgi:hypothetical protein